MKYFTKELCKGCMYLPVCWMEADARAEVFSEEYFQETYAAKLKKHLQEMRDAQRSLGEKCGQPSQDRDINLDLFKQEFEAKVAHIPQAYPPELLEKVVDVRVMALGVVAPGLKAEITKYNANFGAGLREAEEASVFCEDYFQRLYAEKLEEHMQLSNKLSTAFAETMQKFSQMEFDEAHHTRAFKEIYESRLAGFTRTWPDELLAKVADVRMLGLFVASPGIKALMEELNRQEEEHAQEKHVRLEECIRVYYDHYQELLWKHPGSFLNEFGFHDAGIRELRRQDEDFIIELGGGSGYTRVKRIIFQNAEILHMDEFMPDTYWLYEEVYEHESGFEILILADNCNPEAKDTLAELVLRAEDVRYEYIEGRV